MRVLTSCHPTKSFIKQLHVPIQNTWHKVLKIARVTRAEICLKYKTYLFRHPPEQKQLACLSKLIGRVNY